MMQTGYIKLYRQIMDDPEYLDEKFDRTHAWIDLILLANFRDSFIVKRGIRIEVKRGQIAKSVDFFCERWKWSHPTVEKFFKKLEACEQICVQRNNVTNLISITNYDRFQPNNEKICEQICEQNKEKKECPLNNIYNINNKPLKEKKENSEKKDNIKENIEKKDNIPQKTTKCGMSTKASEDEKLARYKACLESRKEDFYRDILPYVGKYDSSMIEDFFRYWTEPDREFHKMRFELQKTWSTGGRLATWYKKSKPK